MKDLRSLAVGVGVLLVGAAIGLWMLTPKAATRIALPGGGEMQVLQVSLGTNHFLSAEPKWKQVARRFTPTTMQPALGPLAGQGTQTRWETLVVCLKWPPLSNGKGLGIDKAEAILVDGVAEEAKVYVLSGVARLTVPCFQRDAGLIPLRVWQGTNRIDFVVNNPRPKQPASWTALAVPQTQLVNRANVVFRGFRQDHMTQRSQQAEYNPLVSVRGVDGNGIGWVYVKNVTIFDRWGNFQQSREGWPGPPRFTRWPPGNGPRRICVQGEEYLSAGFYPEWTNGLVQPIPPTSRMLELGIRRLFLTGPGTYEITNGTLASANRPALDTRGLLFAAEGPTGRDKRLIFTTQTPMIYCQSEVLPGIPAPR
ncbi:MAG: hypothetical protein JWM16_5485, partial [Verrucomicrobiales bacterium]|nr:hypothetical protein [Verrucomicrobiales bacterium]